MKIHLIHTDFKKLNRFVFNLYTANIKITSKFCYANHRNIGLYLFDF